VNSESTRRTFLRDSTRAAIAAWAVLELPWIGALTGCTDDKRASGPLVRLTPAEANALRAFAAQIIPSGDGQPGAVEAGAVEFVDRALGMAYFAELVPVMRAGLADLDTRARPLGARDFASLPNEQQVTTMREIEREPFFAAARTLVIIGTFADPAYGGNRNGAGWDLVKIEHRPSYQAPYGWYDARPNAEGQSSTAKRVA